MILQVFVLATWTFLDIDKHSLKMSFKETHSPKGSLRPGFCKASSHSNTSQMILIACYVAEALSHLTTQYVYI